MDEDVADAAAVRQDEAVALGHVEPLDGAGDLDDPGNVTVEGFVGGCSCLVKEALSPIRMPPETRHAAADSCQQINTVEFGLCKGQAGFFHICDSAETVGPAPAGCRRGGWSPMFAGSETPEENMRYLHTMVRIADIDQSLDFDVVTSSA